MMKVGFIGLGVMGKPMARNLLRASFPLVVHNRSRPSVEELAAEGAEAASSPAELSAQVEVVISCLPDSPDVERVALGSGGIVEGIGEGAIYVDMSTISPVTTRKVADALAEKRCRHGEHEDRFGGGERVGDGDIQMLQRHQGQPEASERDHQNGAAEPCQQRWIPQGSEPCIETLAKNPEAEDADRAGQHSQPGGLNGAHL